MSLPRHSDDAAAMQRLASALVDRYRIERELGAGGMATVYLAHDIRHDRPVAIKVLHQEVAESLGRERFLREIRLAAKLTHPHILPLHDSGEEVTEHDGTVSGARGAASTSAHAS